MSMLNRKAQGDVISAVIIVVIAIGLVGTAYMWGIPLIEKQQGRATVERLDSYFDRTNVNSLPRMIEDVANNGGEKTFYSNIDGLWTLNEYDLGEEKTNSLEFMIASKVSNIGTDLGWISLTSGAACPPTIGVLGVDESSVVCARADSTGTNYNVTYRLWFREVDESAGTRGYKINLVRKEGGPLMSTGKSIRVSRGDVETVTEGGKTLITTEVKILLE
jgi:hypothetical protein